MCFFSSCCLPNRLAQPSDGQMNGLFMYLTRKFQHKTVMVFMMKVLIYSLFIVNVWSV